VLYVYIYIYICMYACIHTHTHTHIHTHVYTYMHTYVCITYMYIHTFIHIHTYTHIYIHVYSGRLGEEAGLFYRCTRSLLAYTYIYMYIQVDLAKKQAKKELEWVRRMPSARQVCQKRPSTPVKETCKL
jgi:hypothetical protein